MFLQRGRCMQAQNASETKATVDDAVLRGVTRYTLGNPLMHSTVEHCFRLTSTKSDLGKRMICSGS
jgi:hypothetical protein